MKKKLLALALCAAMTITLSGCGNELSDKNITIKKYKGLEVAQVEKTEVTEEDVENTIDGYLKAIPLKEEVTDRAVKMGDTINLDYVGSVDGVEFDGGSTRGQGTEIVVGQAGYIGKYGEYKGFEEQLVGHKKGEEFDITVKFPADYQMKELADAVAVFHITINGIYEVQPVTELTEEWVKQYSENAKTPEEFKKEVSKSMKEAEENRQKATLRSEVLAALAEQAEVKKYPEEELKKYREQMENYYKEDAKNRNIEFGEYLETYYQMTEKDFEKTAVEFAENTVKMNLAVKLLAEKKHLEPSEKEYKKQLEEYAKEAGVSAEEFEKVYTKETILEKMTQEAVADYLISECVQVEPEKLNSK